MCVLSISCQIYVSRSVFGASSCSYYALKEYFVDNGVVYSLLDSTFTSLYSFMVRV